MMVHFTEQFIHALQAFFAAKVLTASSSKLTFRASLHSVLNLGKSAKIST